MILNFTLYLGRSSRRTPRVLIAERKKQLIRQLYSHNETGLQLVILPGKGRGVIATKEFKCGDFVVAYQGDLLDIGDALQREERYAQDESLGSYMYYFQFREKKYCIDATKESGRLGRLLNHSRNGNCKTKVVDFWGNPYLVLVAARDIVCGEELEYDYGERNKAVIAANPWLAL